jgi:hypothetical protein
MFRAISSVVQRAVGVGVMKTSQQKPDLSLLALLDYFDQQVLAAYRNEPHKYLIESDYLEGLLSLTNEYFIELEAAGRTNESVSISFGYRTLWDGNLAIVAWLPDLVEKSKSHIERWAAFRLKNPEWKKTDDDERFSNWLRRYVEGSWDIDNGPLFYLGEAIKTVNGLTSELVGVPLYKHEIEQTLGFPSAENTHRYQDAHRALYGYFIDGLDKDCIVALGSKLGNNLRVNSKKTVEAVAELFPGLQTCPSFSFATKLVSEQRRLASHGVRPKPKSFSAFSEFTNDLSLCLKAVKELLTMIENEFGVNGEAARKRHEAKEWLPKIDHLRDPHSTIMEARRMEGKTVEKVEAGYREDRAGVHGSEVVIIHFTDGSIMGLETGSNAGNIASSDNNNALRPEDFHVNFRPQWVPELPKGTRKS